VKLSLESGAPPMLRAVLMRLATCLRMIQAQRSRNAGRFHHGVALGGTSPN